jgi:hypothetical protein
MLHRITTKFPAGCAQWAAMSECEWTARHSGAACHVDRDQGVFRRPGPSIVLYTCRNLASSPQAERISVHKKSSYISRRSVVKFFRLHCCSTPNFLLLLTLPENIFILVATLLASNSAAAFCILYALALRRLLSLFFLISLLSLFFTFFNFIFQCVACPIAGVSRIRTSFKPTIPRYTACHAFLTGGPRKVRIKSPASSCPTDYRWPYLAARLPLWRRELTCHQQPNMPILESHDSALAPSAYIPFHKEKLCKGPQFFSSRSFTRACLSKSTILVPNPK